MSNLEIGLPDGAEDFVGADAQELERMRSDLLSKFKRHGCQLVMPSLIEFSESLGGKMNESLKDFAYSFSDESSSSEIAVRPDISQQIARIDTQLGNKENQKYCYFGETLRKTKDSLTKSRIAYKAGVELFGKINSAEEISTIKLLISSLKSLGKYKITLSLGRTEPLFAIIDGLDLSKDDVKKLKKIMSSKSSSDLLDFCKARKIKGAHYKELNNLISLHGTNESLKYLKQHKKKIFQESAKKVEKVIKNLPSSLNYHLDFSDFPGFDYHKGLVFSVHLEEFGFSLAKGGQYLVENLGSKREAIGFDINVSSLVKIKNKK